MSLVQRSTRTQGWVRLFASRTFAAGALSLAVLGAGVVTTGCKHEPAPTDTNASLYDRLGGEKAITVVVDDFVAKAAADPAVNFTRKGHPNEWDPSKDDNMPRFKKHLIQFVSMATGGPSKYEGRPNAEVHTGMQITEDEWKAAVADLKYALDKNHVPQNLQDELINVVATTHNDVVGR